MATKTKTQKPPVSVCTVCGKTITRTGTLAAGVGHTCQQNATPQVAQHLATLQGTVPPGYITLQAVGKVVKAAMAKGNPPGLTIAKLVRYVGYDRGVAWLPSHPKHIPNLNPIAKPVYFNGVRYVNPWLATPQGLKAIAGFVPGVTPVPQPPATPATPATPPANNGK